MKQIWQNSYDSTDLTAKESLGGFLGSLASFSLKPAEHSWSANNDVQLLIKKLLLLYIPTI